MLAARIPLLLMLCALSGAAAAECACIWQGSFAAVQARADMVVSATVLSSRGNSVDLRIDRLLRGESNVEEIRTWLDTGDLCRAAPGSFPAGSQWVMALDRIETVIAGGFNPHTPDISYGRVGDYSLSRCGGYWLQQSDNLVTGNLVTGPRWDMNPKMSPVLLELVAGYVAGDINLATLEEASRVDPAVQELIINTRLYLKYQR